MIFFGPKLSSKNPKINAPIPAAMFKTIAKLTTSLKNYAPNGSEDNS